MSNKRRQLQGLTIDLTNPIHDCHTARDTRILTARDGKRSPIGRNARTCGKVISLARIFEELRGTEAEESFNQSTDGELTLEDLAAIRSVAFATTSRDNGFGMHFVLFMEDR